MESVFLHVGGASTASVIISLVAIFFLMLIMSFAFWRGPQDEHRFSGPWFAAWIKASTPRIIVAAIFCTGLFFASYFSGGSDTEAQDPEICSVGLAPITQQPITNERLAQGAEGLRELAGFARGGDFDRAQVLLRSDAHNITHDVDTALRPFDPDLARDLCRSIIQLENEMAEAEPDANTVVTQAERSASLIEEARTVLATSGPTATPDPFENPGNTACDNPIGAITNEPVTSERIQNAVTRLETVADAAVSGDTASMSTLFFGDAHDVTHDIDGPLRDANLELAKDLCLNILTLEIQLAGRYELDTIETAATRSAELLLEAEQTLDLPQ